MCQLVLTPVLRTIGTQLILERELRLIAFWIGHTDLRHGAAGLVMNRVIAPALGHALDAHAAAEAESLLKASLKSMETLWLMEKGSFLTGSLQPSIADLSLACEVMQLQVLAVIYIIYFTHNVADLLDPNPKVKKWLSAVEKTLSLYLSQNTRDFAESSQYVPEKKGKRS
ncbi:hypothetical protein L7F22_045186 [Adiantum nelumboides]|nr:hypothetical protein [Adiantum nelumboides]